MNELIKIENLHKTYPDGHVHALFGIDLTIKQNEYIAIMGPSGSGKSTLLNMIGGLDVPTSGSLSVHADNIGIVFQSFYLLPTLTAVENVQMPMFETSLNAKSREEKALELLSYVEMSHRPHHLPSYLSVGEKQRVAIARALANDPELILADEPTGNLDSHTAQEVLTLFDTLHKDNGKTLIVITHDMSVAKRADRIIHMLDGKLV